MNRKLLSLLALICLSGCMHQSADYFENTSDFISKKDQGESHKKIGVLDPKNLTEFLINGNKNCSSYSNKKVNFEVDLKDFQLDGSVKVLEKYDELKGSATYNDCYHSFEYLGNWCEYEIYMVVSRGGGSGTFTNIHFFKIDMNSGELQEFNVGEGDRAFGGILPHPIFVNEKLYYYRKLCDDELLAAAGIKSDKTIGCATRVAAIGLFVFEPNKRKENPKGELVQLKLINPREDIAFCNYSKILRAKIAEHRVIFDKKGMGDLFNELRAG
jgi:hypothetical protein